MKQYLRHSIQRVPCHLQHLLVSVREELNKATQKLRHVIAIVGPRVGAEGEEDGNGRPGYTQVIAPEKKKKLMQ